MLYSRFTYAQFRTVLVPPRLDSRIPSPLQTIAWRAGSVGFPAAGARFVSFKVAAAAAPQRAFRYLSSSSAITAIG